MKKLLKILKWFFVSITAFVVVGIMFLHTLDFSLSEDEILSSFQNLKFDPDFTFAETDFSDIHYVAIGDTSKTKVIFVHGSPGSWDNFRRFLTDEQLLKSFRIISIDRPGYGKSDSGKPARKLSNQAKAILAVLEKENNSTKNIFVGHSYGGPVIARFAIEYPELTNGLIFVAASVDPDLEKTKWFQVPVHYKVLSWILPDMLYSANEEILALKNELTILENKWNQVKVPVSVIQGTKDRLVPYENAEFLKEKLSNTKPKMVIEDINHFIPWENSHLIKQEILWFNDDSN